MTFTKISETWDNNLKTGEEVEQEFLGILRLIYPKSFKIEGNHKEADIEIPEVEKLVEIKMDLKSNSTHNFAFEFECNGKKSGLAATKADLWVSTDGRTFYLFETEKLKRHLRDNWEHVKKIRGGDGGNAKMILIEKVHIAQQSFCALVERGDLFSIRRLRRSLEFLFDIKG